MSEVTDNDVADAITEVDDSDTVKNDEGTTMGKGDPTSMKEMMKTMSKTSDGTNVLKESIQTFSNPDGSDKKGDAMLPVSEIDVAVVMIKNLIEASKEKSKPKKKERWNFNTCPHEQFEKTLDDVFVSFLMWARTEGEEKNINVSKAFRRLEQYADWMEDSKEDLVDPLTPDSVWEALQVWKMKGSIDKHGRFAWWVTFRDIDAKKIKELDPKDHVRAFVWYSHYVMFDPNAQENGIIFIEDCDHIGFLESITLMPMKVGAKLDRLTIGVLPVKMKAMLLLECPGWINLFMKFMRMFMSKKMKERLQVVKDWSYIAKEVGEENIPLGFGKIEGKLTVDPIIDKYFKEKITL